MNDDAALLRRYADQGSDDAFAELVRRHVDLVYGAALRRTSNDPHAAADVTQQVFTAVAQQARKLSQHPVLAAWLHTATRNAALNLMISEQRRKARELQAVELATAGDAAPDWQQVRPVLDAAIDELPETDRAAVVLRVLERRPFSEIGTVLHLSENAARMRTDRALEKLRVIFARRGITSTAAALGTLVATHSVASAPAGLAAAIASHSLVLTASAPGLVTFLGSLMKTKIIIASAVGAFLFFGIGAYVGTNRLTDVPPPPAAETPQQSRMVASLREENSRLIDEVGRLNTVNASLATERAALQAAVVAAKKGGPQPPLSPVEQKQRAMLNNLRQIAAARDQFVVENGRPPASVLEILGADKYIRQVNPVDGEDYSNLSMSGDNFTLTAADGTSVTYKQEMYTPAAETPERQRAKAAMQRVRELGKKVNPLVRPAIEAYKAANSGALPPNHEALIPYFTNAQEGADFVEYLEAEKAARAK